MSYVRDTNLSNVSYATVPLNEQGFSARCALPPQQTIRVPQVKHIVHRTPIIQESITEEVTYIEVPVQHYFEQRDYPQKVLAAVCPVMAAPPCAPKNMCGC